MHKTRDGRAGYSNDGWRVWAIPSKAKLQRKARTCRTSEKNQTDSGRIVLKAKAAIKKPCSKWKKPTARVRGRIIHEVDFGVMDCPVLKKVVFELRPGVGLVVRKLRSRKTSARTWTFNHLANVARGQMELFPAETKTIKRNQ